MLLCEVSPESAGNVISKQRQLAEAEERHKPLNPVGKLNDVAPHPKLETTEECQVCPRRAPRPNGRNPHSCGLGSTGVEVRNSRHRASSPGGGRAGC